MPHYHLRWKRSRRRPYVCLAFRESEFAPGDDDEMTGGVAKNSGVIAFMEEKLGQRVNISKEPKIVGALDEACLCNYRVNYRVRLPRCFPRSVVWKEDR
jgi:hypothetical protein